MDGDRAEAEPAPAHRAQASALHQLSQLGGCDEALDGKPALVPARLPLPGSVAGVPLATFGAGINTSPLLCGVGILMTGPLYSLSVAILHQEFFGTLSATTWKKPADPFLEV